MPTPVSVRDKRAKARKRTAKLRNIVKELKEGSAKAASSRNWKKIGKGLVKELGRKHSLGPRGTTPQGPRLTKGRKTTTRTRRR
jgi:hypothetical protein